MRKLFILLLLCICSIVQAQEYHILHVKGEILVGGKPILPGDKINAEDKIQFGSSDAVAAALSPDKGRYIIRVDKTKPVNSDLIYILSATVAPVRGGMSTRAGGGITNPLNLSAYFGSSPYVWVGDKIVLEISPEAYKMDDTHFFFLRYNFMGEIINKQLGHEGNKLIISKSETFTIDEQPIDKSKASDFEFYYYDELAEESRIITPAFFIFLTVDDVKEMYGAMGDSEDRYKEIANILSEFYGLCDPKQLELNLSN